MLNEEQIHALLEETVCAETRAYYFAEQCNRLQQIQRWVTFGSLLLASAAAAAFASKIDPALASALALLSAAASAYTLSFQNQKRAIDAADLHSRWNQLSIEYTLLYADPSSEDAEARLKVLMARAAEASKAGSVFPEDKKSMMKWQRLVHSHHGLPA